MIRSIAIGDQDFLVPRISKNIYKELGMKRIKLGFLSAKGTTHDFECPVYHPLHSSLILLASVLQYFSLKEFILKPWIGPLFKYFPLSMIILTTCSFSVHASTKGYSAETYSGFQERRLFSPTPAEFEIEQRGQVFMYEGLFEQQVDIALDQHFDRIQNMMFIRTKSMINGEVEEDNDCD